MQEKIKGQIHKAAAWLLRQKIRANSTKNSASNPQSGHKKCKGAENEPKHR